MLASTRPIYTYTMNFPKIPWKDKSELSKNIFPSDEHVRIKHANIYVTIIKKFDLVSVVQ